MHCIPMLWVPPATYFHVWWAITRIGELVESLRFGTPDQTMIAAFDDPNSPRDSNL
jgi:hypothetical protein